MGYKLENMSAGNRKERIFCFLPLGILVLEAGRLEGFSTRVRRHR